MEKRKKSKWKKKIKYIICASILFLSSYTNADSLGGFDIEIGEGAQNGYIPGWDSTGTDMEETWAQETESGIYGEISAQVPEIIQEMPTPAAETIQEMPMPVPEIIQEMPTPVPETIQEMPMPVPEIIQETPMLVPEIIHEIQAQTTETPQEKAETMPQEDARITVVPSQSASQMREPTPQAVHRTIESVNSKEVHPSTAPIETSSALHAGQEVFYFSSTAPKEGKVCLEIKTEEPVYILSFRVGQKERMWHWEEGRIAVEAKKGEAGEKIELLIICEKKDKIQVFIDDTLI